MHTHTTSLVSSLSPEEILDRFRQLSADRGWTLTSEDRTRVHAQSGLSLKSAGEDIEVSVDPKADGIHVRLVVTPRLGALQLIDWGEGSTFEREVLKSLGAPLVSND